MSDKRITDLPELLYPSLSAVFPIVDVDNITKKVKFSTLNSFLDTDSTNQIKTFVINNSSFWNYQGTDLKQLSSFWDRSSTLVRDNSSKWTVYDTVNSISSFWVSVYTTVNTNSASWSSGQGITNNNSLTAYWESARTWVNANSSIVNDVKIWVNSNSSVLIDLKTWTISNSSNILDSTTWTNTNSSTLVDTRTWVNSNSSTLVDTRTWVNTNSSNILDSTTWTNTNSSNVLDSTTWVNTNSSNILDSTTWVNTNSSNILDSTTWTNTNSSTLLDAKTWTNTNSSTLLDAKTWTNTNSSTLLDAKTWTNTNSSTLVDARTWTNTNSSTLVDARTWVNTNSSTLLDSNTWTNTNSSTLLDSNTWTNTNSSKLDTVFNLVTASSSLFLNDFSKVQEFFDDFITLDPTLSLPNALLYRANFGGSIYVEKENTKQGVLVINCNTIANINQRGGANSNSTFHFGQGTEYKLIFSARRGTNTFDDSISGRLEMGFHNQIGTNSFLPQHGCFFLSENGGTWKAITLSEPTPAIITDTLIPCDTQWRIFEINVDSLATRVQYKIDNNIVCTHTDSIPKTLNSQTGIGYRSYRLANNPLEVQLRLDWQSLTIKRQTNLWL